MFVIFKFNLKYTFPQMIENVFHHSGNDNLESKTSWNFDRLPPQQ